MNDTRSYVVCGVHISYKINPLINCVKLSHIRAQRMESDDMYYVKSSYRIY